MKQQKSIVKKMGDILIKEDVINLDQLKSAIQEQKHSGRKLGETLLNLGYIDENQLVAYLSKQYAVPAINLEQFEVSEEALKLVPRETAFKHKLVPIDRSGSTLVVAMADPSNIFAIDDLKFATGQNIEVVVASERSIKTAIESHYGSQAEWDKKVQVEKSQEELGNLIGDIEDFVLDGSGEEKIDLNDLQHASEEAPVIRLVNFILLEAIRREASDIHVEPYENDYRVRLRIDGVLYDILKPPRQLRNAVSSRIKVMSNLDIAERRLPQDGRMFDGNEFAINSNNRR